MNADAAVVTLLQEIRDEMRLQTAELRGLRLAVGGQSGPPRRLSPADEAMLATLLPIVAVALEDSKRDSKRDDYPNFSVHDLVRGAQRVEIKPAAALREALALMGSEPRKIGRLLRRASRADVAIAGFRVMAIGTCKDGVLWKLTKEKSQNSPR
jgi:hypothetical protein